MGPAVQVGNTFTFTDFVISSITVGLQIAFKTCQYIIGSLSASPGLVIKKYGFIYRVMVHPVIPLMGGALFVPINDFNW